MNIKNKNILITGAGGFIGSHLTEKLVKSSRKVRVFLRYNSRNSRGNLEFLPDKQVDNLDIFTGDLKDPEAVRKAMKGIDVVFHLGAVIAIPYSYINPLDFTQTNVLGTANVLNAALNSGVERIVHTSTSEVYGTALYQPINEEHPLQAQSPYSASKIAADKLAESYFCSFSLPITTIRPFNTYGPRQSARAVIPTIISQALSSSKIKLGSLTPKRDMNYVKDTVSAFIKIAESDKAIGEVINIGTGLNYTIKEIAQHVIELLGKKGKIDIEYDRKRVRPKNSEVATLIADNSKAKSIIGYMPKYNLSQGLKATMAWAKKYNHMYKSKIYNI